MNKFNNVSKDISSYIQTAIVSIFIALLVVSASLFFLQRDVYSDERNKNMTNEAIDYNLIGILIDKNKYLEQQDPQNYSINLKLGVLYEIKEDYKNAEIEYKKSIAKAPFGEYRPTYKLATLYIKTKKINQAEALTDNITDSPNQDVIFYKGELYNNIGEYFYQKGDYDSAIELFKKALPYFNVLNTKEKESVKKSLVSSYVYYADEKVENLEFDDAISLLNMARTIVDAPILKYKLALLLMKDNPGLAYQYFDQVFKDEPSLINYDTYLSFLTAISMEADENGQAAQAELYKYKIKKLKEFYTTNILTIRDISIEDMKGSVTFNWIKQQYDIKYTFKIKNISENDINSLYLEVIFMDGEAEIQKYANYFITSKTPLVSGEVSPDIVLYSKVRKKDFEQEAKKINVSVFAAKTQKAYRIHLGTTSIKEKIGSNKLTNLIRLRFVR